MLFLVRRIPLHEPLLLVFVGHVEIAGLLVERADLLHLVVGEGEVEDLVTYSNSYSRLDFLADMGGVRRAGDDREALLHMPADDDLGSGLAHTRLVLVGMGVSMWR
mgnify:CR=1 FL=1